MGTKRQRIEDVCHHSKRPRLLGGNTASDAQQNDIRDKALAAALARSAQKGLIKSNPKPASDDNGKTAISGITKSISVPLGGNFSATNVPPQAVVSADKPSSSATVTVGKDVHPDQNVEAVTSPTPEQIRGSIGQFFEPPLQVEQTFIDTLSVIPVRDQQKPCGVRNDNNKCYRNAVLTALIGSDRFIQYLKGWHMPQEYDKESGYQQNKGHLLQLFDNIRFWADAVPASPDDERDLTRAVRHLWKTTCYRRRKSARPVTITTFWENSWYKTPPSEGGDENSQEDAGCFLTWLFESIEGQFANAQSLVTEDLHQSKFSYLTKIRLASRMLCPICAKVQQRVEARSENSPWMLDLEPTRQPEGQPSRRDVSLEECLKNTLNERMEWRCDRCATRSWTTKQNKIQHAPPVLIMNLGRAYRTPIIPKEDSQGNPLKDANNNWIIEKEAQDCKDLTAVQIPQHLDVSRWLNPHEFGEGSKVQYKLASVVSHQGATLHRGHYVSHVRGGSRRNEWYCLDDHHVSRILYDKLSDNDVADMSANAFSNRRTPVLLIYDRDFPTEVVKPGRAHSNLEKAKVDTEDHSQSTTHPDDNVAPPAPEEQNLQTSALAQPGAVTNTTASASLPQSTDGLHSSTASKTSKTVDESNDQSSKTTPGQVSNDGHGQGAADLFKAIQTACSVTVPQSALVQTRDAGTQTNLQSDVDVSQVPAITVSGSEDDVDWPQAEVETKLKIGDTIIQYPKAFIQQFNRATARDIEFDAKITVPGGKAAKVEAKIASELDYFELDLAEAVVDQEIKQRKKDQRLKQAPKSWKKRWQVVKHTQNDRWRRGTNQSLRSAKR